MDKLKYLVPVVAAGTLYSIYKNTDGGNKKKLKELDLNINTENIDEITIKYNKDNNCIKSKREHKNMKETKYSLFNFDLNNTDKRTYMRDYFREDGKNDTSSTKLPKPKSNIDYKMNQIFYMVKNIYKIHNVFSSVMRIKSRTGQSNGTIKKNLSELSSLLVTIKKSAPRDYPFYEYLHKYSIIIYKITKKLIDNDYNILECVAEADEIIQEWYHLHDVYYINSKNL